MKAHLVGGGLASMAAAAYLLEDGGLMGADITIYEASEDLGGSLGLAGTEDHGFIYPGGRVFEQQYRCALDLFDLIPSRVHPNRSIREDIEFFNEHHSWKNKCRLVDRNGRVVDARKLGLSLRDKFDLVRTILTPEKALDGKEIRDVVSAHFFQTNFWFMWSSIMAFVPEHSAMEFRRYLRRFFHILPQLATMEFILRTRYHQQQSIVRPMEAWLEERGVRRRKGCLVRHIGLSRAAGRITARYLLCEEGARERRVDLDNSDIVLVTNGSQLADMTTGTMDEPPPSEAKMPGSSWLLWRALSDEEGEFGNPSAFTEHREHSTWISFTVHTRSDLLMDHLENLTGREAGRGGLITFKDSRWLITLTRFHDPNLIGQDAGEHTIWGYGIYPEKPGDFVGKPMTDCTGREIFRELLGHLHLTEGEDAIMEASQLLPCRLPFASAVCLKRNLADRPKVVPDTSTNLGFIGQFCEQPEDVIFTMEYSVRSARNAVSQLLETGNPPPKIYRGYLDPATVVKVALAAFR